jgi:hypothetical protein
MHAIEPGETPSRILKWSSLGFLIHIKRRTIGDRFPLPLWEVWPPKFCSTLSVPIPALLDLLSGALVMLSTMMFVEITCRLAKLSRRLHRFMIGWCIVWETF